MDVPNDNSIKQVKEKHLPLVGAYSDRDCTDPSVLVAAEYLKNLYISSSLLQQSLQQKDVSFQVYKAAVQVVAGLNFKLSIRLFHGKDHDDDKICIGSLENVVIYRDLSQSYSITQWGTFYPCEEEKEEKEEEIIRYSETDENYDTK